MKQIINTEISYSRPICRMNVWYRNMQQYKCISTEFGLIQEARYTYSMQDIAWIEFQYTYILLLAKKECFKIQA